MFWGYQNVFFPVISRHWFMHTNFPILWNNKTAKNILTESASFADSSDLE